MIVIKIRLIAAGILAVCVAAVIVLQKPRQRSFTVYDVFDTVCTVSTYSGADNLSEYEQLLRNADEMFSAEKEGAQIYALNSEGSAKLSAETTALLCDAVDYTNQLGEYFDVSIKPVSDAWDIKNNPGVIPADIPQRLPLVGIGCIRIDKENNSAEIVREGAGITLGAIAKGYATDMLVKAMRTNGEKSALINLGGNIYALGSKPDGSEWKISIMDPKDTQCSTAVLEVSDTAVITSGNYERYFELDGRRYHHIIDPKTGYPAESGLNSATAIGKNAELCDVLSTAMFVAGLDGAEDLAARYGVEAVLVTDDTVYSTPGISESIVSIGDGYNYAVFD